MESLLGCLLEAELGLSVYRFFEGAKVGGCDGEFVGLFVGGCDGV